MGPMNLRPLVSRVSLGLLLGLGLGVAAWAAGDAPKPAGPAATPALKVGLPPPPPGSEGDFPRPVNSWLEAQIALARQGISCGSIDGIQGAQSVAALQAWQEREGLPSSGAWMRRRGSSSSWRLRPSSG